MGLLQKSVHVRASFLELFNFCVFVLRRRRVFGCVLVGGSLQRIIMEFSGLLVLEALFSVYLLNSKSPKTNLIHVLRAARLLNPRHSRCALESLPWAL